MKAFNNLPREPLFHVASRVGLPVEVLRPWQSFLRQVSRRFLIRGFVSSPIQSTSGFAEGCPLSTVAMALSNLLYHKYLEVFQPRLLSMAVVGNLTCVADTVGGVVVLTTPGASATFWIWRSKTFVWAVQPKQRKELTALALPVLSSARELGGIMSFSRARRNQPLKERIKDPGLAARFVASCPFCI